jgi:thermitase
MEIFGKWSAMREEHKMKARAKTHVGLVLLTILCLSELSFAKSITVAVIDTGIDTTFETLKKGQWINPGEAGTDPSGQCKCNNGLDDDNNGYIDDIHGWNFANQNANIKDTHGHGTHIAGIILNGQSEIKILSAKYFDSRASDTMKASLEALAYSIDQNVDIINYSGGGNSYHPLEFKLLKKAQSKGILVVAAAGNERSNADDHPFYPAAYDLDNIISVAAIDENLNLLPSSNYGKRSIHIAAIGKEVLSIGLGGKEVKLTGTSQATAVVSALAAQLKLQTGANYKILKEKILNLRKPAQSLSEKIQTEGILNSERSLSQRAEYEMASDIFIKPNTIKDLSVFESTIAQVPEMQ